ncbi:MAG: hypothetical protein WDZ88_03360 [Candidatus Paceibacterota bacterium]
MKHNMTYTTLTARIFGATLAVLMAVVAVPVSADNGLDVTFEQQPLFNEANFLPGDTVSRTVQVHNTTGATQSVITSTDNESDTNDFSEQFAFEIVDTSDNTVYFSGTLKDLFDGDVANLGSIVNNQTRTFAFKATLNSGTGNAFQGAAIGFDLAVGFFGGEVVTDNPPTNPPGGGGGGSGGGGSGGGGGGSSGGGGGGVLTDIERLEITNVQVVSKDWNTGEVVISWETNLPASSQIVYGLTSSGPHNLNSTFPNFGYPQSNTKDSTQKELHQMTLTGLTSFEWYDFIVASERLEVSISLEGSFYLGPEIGGDFPIILENDPENNEQGQPPVILAQSGTTPPPSNVFTEGTDEGTEEGTGSSEGSSLGANKVAENNLNSPGNGLLAALIFSLPESIREAIKCVSGAVIILLAVFLIWLLIVDRKELQYGTKWEFFKFKMRFIITSAIVGLVVLLLLKQWCSIIPLIVLIILIIAYISWVYKRGVKSVE